MFKVFEYACGKFYEVFYKRGGVVTRVFGLMLNYTPLKIVLLAPAGMYYIDTSTIEFMTPHKECSKSVPKEYYEAVIEWVECNYETCTKE